MEKKKFYLIVVCIFLVLWYERDVIMTYATIMYGIWIASMLKTCLCVIIVHMEFVSVMY